VHHNERPPVINVICKDANMTEHTASRHSSVLSENVPGTLVEPVGFMPSSVSAREQRAREQADRTISEFIEKFTEKGFFPLDCETLIFSLLPQLAKWPSDLQLKVLNEQGDTIATYLKGTDPSVIQNSVSVVQDRYGEYDTASVEGEETLFELIFSQLPADSELGRGGDFVGDSTIAGRIITLRKQLAGLLKAERTSVFEALLADEARMKRDTDFSKHNRFLPLWRQQPVNRSPVLNTLLALNPSMPSGRIEVLLERFPLSDEQQREFLEEGSLPDPFIDAWNLSVDEWRKDREIDGIFHTRTYNVDTDSLTRTLCQRVLKDRLGYELLVVEASETPQNREDVIDSSTSISLSHRGNGDYLVNNVDDDRYASLKVVDDSFYWAIAWGLQPNERLTLGMQFENDIAGFRSMLGTVAATANGGWFDVQKPLQVENEQLPDWLKNASAADTLTWNTALQTYWQALIEAQAPALPDISQYGDVKQLRSYTKGQLERRLDTDLGLRWDPEEIIVETTESQWTGNQEGPPGLLSGGERPLPGEEFEYFTTRRSLIQLCIENLGVDDVGFWLTARFLGPNGRPILALSKAYVHGLVRELNVGDSYAAFLKKRLLTSSLGQWSRDKYTQVMDAQMRLDSIEAKLAGDFSYRLGLPPNLADQGYRWVQAVLDRALDSNDIKMVERHRIRVQELKLTDLTPTNLHYYGLPGVYSPGLFDELTLQGVLMIAAESRQSVSNVVIYTPSAPDGLRFREFDNDAHMRDQLFKNPLLGCYWVSRLALVPKPSLGQVFGTLIDEGHLKVVASPLRSDNFYFESYGAEVQRIIDQVDAQTTSTSEKNWQTAWNIASSLAELAIEFTPFKVRLPIAAARSIYALSQGARAVGEGNSSAVLHFVQAGLLLTDGLPGGKRPKAIKASSNGLKPAKALTTSPDGLTPRTDGIYNGVHEKPNVAGPSDFYAQSEGKTFPIRYDADKATWRIIDPRRPDAYYQVPIRIDGQGHWNYDSIGLGGGGRDKVPRGAKASDAPAATSAVNTPSGGKKLFTLKMDDFFEGREFKKAQKRVPDDDLEIAINKAVEKYRVEGKGSLHPSAGGRYSLDLPGLGGSSGRGAWRLMFTRVKDKDPATGKVPEMLLVVHSVQDPH
jgi:hypothetical protein